MKNFLRLLLVFTLFTPAATLWAQCQPLAAGTYSVGQGGVFGNLQHAIDSLRCAGTTGEVQLQLAVDTYIGPFVLDSLPGVAHRVRITGGIGVVLRNQPAAIAPEVLLIRGGHWQLEQLQFTRDVALFNGPLVKALAPARLRVLQCDFTDLSAQNSLENRAIQVTGIDSLGLLQNRFEGFSEVLALGQLNALQMENNRFSAYKTVAIRASQLQNPGIRGNRFDHVSTSSPASTVVHLHDFSGLDFSRNQVLGRLPAMAFIFTAARILPLVENRIYNNEISGTLLGSGAALVQLLADTNAAQALLFVNNTIQLKLLAGSNNFSMLAMAGWRAGVDSLLLLNNIFMAELQGAALPSNIYLQQADGPARAGWFNNHNVYFLPGGSAQMFFRSDNQQSFSLAAWRSVSGYEAQSLEADPWLRSIQQAQPANPQLNNAAQSVFWLNGDILGQFRPVSPDPGAYEFNPFPRDLALIALNLPASACELSDSVFIEVQVRNLGEDTLYNLPLNYQFNQQPGVQQNFSDTLLPGQHRWLQFDSPANWSAPGAYHIEVWSSLAGDLFSGNDSMTANRLNAAIDQLPVYEDFESQLANSRSLINRLWEDASAGSYHWQVQRGARANGPAADAGGNVLGQYLSTAGQVAPTDTAVFVLGCVASPVGIADLSYRLFARETSGGHLRVEALVNGQWELLDSIAGSLQTNGQEPWIYRRKFIQAASAIRFMAIRTATVTGHWAIDNIGMETLQFDNLMLDSVQWQAGSCDSNGLISATLFVTNIGLNAQSNWGAGALVGTQPIVRTVLRNLPAGASDTIQIQWPWATAGLQTTRFFSALNADADSQGDTIALVLPITGRVNTFPYVDGFEAGSSWIPVGERTSWQLTSPAGNRINGAAQGQQAWITQSAGVPNQLEDSWLLSPCFDFSNLVFPRLQLAINYDLNQKMQARIEYRTPAQPGWQLLGNYFDGLNWYNQSPPVGLTQAGWGGNSQGWVAAEYLMEELSGLAEVQLRIRFIYTSDTLLSATAAEGVAIDHIRIGEMPGARARLLALPNPCDTNAVRNIQFQVSNATQAQQVQLLYRVNGGTEMALTATPMGNVYQVSVPAQPAGQPVQMRVAVQSDSLRYSALRFYTTAFLQSQLPDLSAPQRTPLTLDAGLAVNRLVSLGNAQLDSARGVSLLMEARRKLALTGFQINVLRFTSVSVYAQVFSGSTPPALHSNEMQLLGRLSGARPNQANFLFLPDTLFLQSGQRVQLYLVADHPAALQLHPASAGSLVTDSAAFFRIGNGTVVAFGSLGASAWPGISVQISNPASQVAWRNADGTLFSTQGQAQQLMPAVTTNISLSLQGAGCSFSDTIGLNPTGAFDLAIDSILSPVLAEVLPGVFYSVKVVLRNKGNLPVNEVSMGYKVNGVEAAVSSLQRTLAPGDTVHFTFPQSWTWVETGAIVFCAYTRNFMLDVQSNDNELCLARFPTSVHDNELADWRLYPNPATTQLFIKHHRGEEPTEFALFDLQGRQLMFQWLEAGLAQHSIRLPALAPGLYVYQLRSVGTAKQGRLLISGREF